MHIVRTTKAMTTTVAATTKDNQEEIHRFGETKEKDRNSPTEINVRLAIARQITRQQYIARHEKKLHVAEMKMLRLMSDVIKMNIVWNHGIAETTKMGEISKKVQKIRLQWYGHVMRRRM